MATALTYRFRTLAIISGATAIIGSLIAWWVWGRGDYSPDGGLPTSQVFVQAWTVAAQILIWLTAVFAAGAVATRIVALAKGWDDDADGDIDDPYDDGGDGLGSSVPLGS